MTKPMHVAALLLASGASQQSTADAALALVAPTQRGPLSSRPIAPSTSSITALDMSKNADRARCERNLEDLMDNDWKAFRARLVLQETRAEGEKDQRWMKGDRRLARQDKLGNLFAEAISSVFQNGNKLSRDTDEHRRSIFDGIAVGGATASSVLPGDVSDPFVSAAELSAFIPSDRIVKLDKHRWAHPLPYVEPGCVMVANERLGGVFHQTVVLIIDHHETLGSTGIVINR